MSEYKISVSDGKAECNIGQLAFGTYNVRAVYSETDNYRSAETVATITVGKAPTNLEVTVNPSTILYDEYFNYDMVLTDNEGNPIDNQYLLFKTGDSVKYFLVTNDEGKVEHSQKLVQVLGDSTDTILTLNCPTSTNVGVQTTITAILEDINDNLLVDQLISFTVDTTTYTARTDTNGVAELIITPTTNGTNNISAMFTGNTLYTGSTTSTSILTITKTDTVISMNEYDSSIKLGNTLVLSGNLKDAKGNPLTGRELTLIIGDLSYTITTGAEGVFNYEYQTNTSTTLNISVSFDSTSVYNGTTYTGASVSVLKYSSYLSIKCEDSVHCLDEFTITGKLINSKNAAIRNETLTFTLTDSKENTQTFTGTTDQYGIVTIITSYAYAGNVNIGISFAGNETYESSSISKSITITKLTPSMNIITSTESLYWGDTGTYTVELPFTADVIFTVEGNSTTITTDENKQAIFTYTFNNVGSIPVQIVYTGDDTYNKVDTTVTVSVNKKPVTLTLQNTSSYTYKDTVPITAKLIDNKDTLLAGEIVTVTIGSISKSITISTDGTGYYNWTASTVGTISITLNYLGSDYYESATITGSIVVNKMQSTLTFGTISTPIYLGQQRTIPLYLTHGGTNAVSETVSITLDGTPVSVTTDGVGLISIPYTFNSTGTLVLTAAYSGSSVYEGATVSISINVLSNTRTAILSSDSEWSVIDATTSPRAPTYSSSGLNVGFQEYLFWDACTVNNNQEFRCLVNSSTVNGYEIGIVSAKKSNPYYMIRYSVSASGSVTLLYRPSTGSTNLGSSVSALSANTDTSIVMGIHDGNAYAKIGNNSYTSSASLADQTDLIFYVRKWNSGSMTLKSLTWEVI